MNETESIVDQPTPRRIAVFYAHPDDAEWLCAGTVAKWTAAGHHVTYVQITHGDKGTEDRELTGKRLSDIRRKEQCDAAAVLGVQDVIFLGHEDNTLNGRDRDLQRELVRVMRTIKPDVVLCQDPSLWWRESSYINHPDHRNAGEAVVAAAFPSAGSWGSFPELLEEGLEPIKIREIWIMGPLSGDHWEDISDTLEVKIEALGKHVSQIEGTGDLESLRGWAAEIGRGIDPPYGAAEEFRVFHTSG
ncbi:MAG: PIG-L deacetylase family protein [Thermomicrobiales bacterium]